MAVAVFVLVCSNCQIAFRLIDYMRFSVYLKCLNCISLLQRLYQLLSACIASVLGALIAGKLSDVFENFVLITQTFETFESPLECVVKRLSKIKWVNSATQAKCSRG